MNKFWLAIATFFGVGYLPIAPGTWASLVTAATLYVVYPWITTPHSLYLALAFVTILGIPAATHAEKHFGKKDPGTCVIDEVAGQMVCLIFVPHSLPHYLTAFLIFRVTDILKPFPIRRIERLGGGWGIMIDDLLAGGYTLAIIYLLISLKVL